MGKLDGKVAFVTGAARGQGRSHAVRLAEEGADIIGVDLCAQVDGVYYQMPDQDDLETTVKLVEATGRRMCRAVADVRDESSLRAALDGGVAALGRLDIVVANAGISSYAGPAQDLDRRLWDDVIDINLTGVWLTAKVAIPHLLARDTGGSIVIINSFAGLRGVRNMIHYVAAKHGAVGIMRTLALELAKHSIRVNSVHPTQVDTPMIQHERVWKLFCQDIEDPTHEDFAAASGKVIPLPIPWVEPVDVSNAVLWLASDEARYVSGAELTVDGAQYVG